MIWSEILSEIKRTLKEPDTGGHWGDDEFLRRANILHRQVCRKTSCIKVYDSSLLSVSGTRAYEKPSDLLQLIEVSYGDDESPVYGISRDNLDVNESLGYIYKWRERQGTPTNFFEDNKYLYLFPTPNENDKVIKLYYSKAPDALVDGDSIPFDNEPHLEDFHDILIYGVTWRCLFEEDKPRWRDEKQEYQSRLIELNRVINRKQFVNDRFLLA